MKLLDAIGDAVNAVGGAITGGAGGVGDIVGDATSMLDDPAGLLEDTFETSDEGGIGGIIGDVLGTVTGGIGGLIEEGLDALGAPDWLGDIASGVGNFCTGQFMAAGEDALSALSGIAESCGGEELSGFLETAGSVGQMFGQPTGATSFGSGEGLSMESPMSGDIEAGMELVGQIQGGDFGAAASGIESLLNGGGDGLVSGIQADDIAAIFENTPLSELDGETLAGALATDDMGAADTEKLAERAGFAADLLGMVAESDGEWLEGLQDVLRGVEEPLDTVDRQRSPISV